MGLNKLLLESKIALEIFCERKQMCQFLKFIDLVELLWKWHLYSIIV